MTANLTRARAIAAAALLRDSFTIVRPRTIDDGMGGQQPHPSGPMRCGPFLGAFHALSGDELVVAEQLSERGAYRLRCAVSLTDPDTSDPVEILHTDYIEVLDATYAVVWTPPPANLSLFTTVGLDNADDALGGAGVLVQTFLGLNDTPDSYGGQAGKLAAVNNDADGLTFLDPSTVGVTDYNDLDNLPDLSVYALNADLAAETAARQAADTAEASARASGDAAAAAALAAHEAASDPHPQYQTQAEGDARFWPLSADLATQTELDAETSARSSADSTNAAAIAAETSARAAADSAHAALTTTAHGGIVASTDPRLSDARTPTAHASSHASAGSDPITIAESQVTNLVSDLAAKVSSVSASSPLQSSGGTTPAISFASQSANRVLAGPSTGSAAAPTFRALVAADIPALSYEPALGNPASDGYVLSSTAAGVRSWVVQSGGVPTTRTLTINGTAQDLSANRSWTVGDALVASANIFTAAQTIALDDAITNTLSTIATLAHTTSGTAAAGFGGQILLRLESDAGTLRDAAAIKWEWATATDASRAAQIALGLDVAGVMSFPFTMTKAGVTFNAPGAVNGDVLFGVSDSGAAYFRITKNASTGHTQVFMVASSSRPGLVIRPGASITGNPFELWSAGGSTVLINFRPDGVATFTKAAATLQKAGIPTDADWTSAPPDGTIVADSTNNRIYVRVGGAWKYAALT